MKRLRFDKAEVHRQDDERSTVEVTLTYAECEVKASREGEGNATGVLKLASRATLEAVERVVEGRFTCELADLDHVNALGKDLIAVLVNIEFEGKQVQVFGSCQVSGSEVDTAVKAALNATNRFFELAMRE
jgi:hypothetical protein